jgi:hypothetical protein
MTKASIPHVLTTPDELALEFVNNKWKERLTQCAKDREDTIREYEEGEREYRKRVISKHFENKILIAVTITKVFDDGHSTHTNKMLLINGIRHIVP